MELGIRPPTSIYAEARGGGDEHPASYKGNAAGERGLVRKRCALKLLQKV